MANEYYKRLDVQPDASSEEIRKSYFAAVRNNPPEKKPDQFKQVQEAYNTLKNEKSRKDYDIQQKHGGELSRLDAEALEAFEANNYDKAIQLYKRALILHPDNTVVMSRLAITLRECEKFNDALRIYEKLFNIDDTNASSFVDGSMCFIGAYSQTKETQYLQRARKWCEKAIALEPINSRAYQVIGMSYHIENKDRKALEYVDKAIFADDKIDYQDVYSFQLKMKICLDSTNVFSLKSLEQQIRENIHDQDLRNHVIALMYQECESVVDAVFEDEHGGLGIKKEYIIFMKEVMRFFQELSFGEAKKAACDLERLLDGVLKKHDLFESFQRQQYRRLTGPTSSASSSSSSFSSSSSSGGGGCVILLVTLIPLGICVALLFLIVK